MTLKDLKLRARALLRPNHVEHELEEELAFHVELEARKLIDEGMTPAEARQRARAHFGSTALAADRCRDERRTAVIDNTIRDVQYALRAFAKAPLPAFTIVVTVAVGLGLVAVVFTVLNALIFHVDQVSDIGEMYAVERTWPANGDASPLTRPMFDAMRADTRVFTDAYATVPGIDLHVDGRRMAVTLVTGNFFQVVRVSPVIGRALAPADDGNAVIVLSHKGWDRHFDREPNVLGRTLLVNGVPFEIIGVTAAGFRGLEVGGPDLWAPLSQRGQFRPGDRGRENEVGVEIVGRLRPGVSRDNARAQLAAWNSNRSADTPDRRSTSIDLLPRRGTVPQPLEAVAVFAPLFVAFGLILMIGCANVANLLLARGVARQREIGIRLSLGASRRRIVRQLMTESVLLGLAAAAGVPLFLLLGAIVSTLLFGLAPALQATRLELVRTMRGELKRDTRPGRARQALIAVQVTASALLLICAAVFLRGAVDAAGADPGLRTSDTVMVDFANEPLREALVGALRAHPSVAVVAASSPGPMGFLRPATAEAAPDDPGGAGRRATVAYQFVSPEYFDVLDIPMLRGRGFTPSERSAASGVVVVSEKTARMLWPDGEALGQVLRMKVDLPSPAILKSQIAAPGAYTVVGVSRDIGMRLHIIGMSFASPDVYLPTTSSDPATTFTMRVHGDPDRAREALLADLTRVDPALVNVRTLRTMAAIEGYIMRAAFVVAMALGALALALTLSGLFGVLSYMIEQRRQEIGVRMALGATTKHVARLVLLQSLRPVGLGLVVGAVLAGSLGRALLAAPVGALFSQFLRVSDPAPYAASLIVITAACVLAALVPALRAARIDPIATLREE
jgi:hypothetical protein